jgi:hypothetical protein
MHPRPEKHFVNVDIAQAGNECLVEEEALDRDSAARKRLAKHPGVQLVSAFRPEPECVHRDLKVVRGNQSQPTELSYIAEIGDRAVLETERNVCSLVRVWPGWVRNRMPGDESPSIRLEYRPLSCEFQVDEKRQLIEAKNEHLGSPAR